jgi:hypothetical protein
MINKIELIKKIINNLKKFNKNTLIHIYNNYLMNSLKIKGGRPNTRAVARALKVFTHNDKYKVRDRNVFIPQQPYAEPIQKRISQLETQNPITVRNSDRIKASSLDRATTTTTRAPISRTTVNFDLATEPINQQRIQQQPQNTFEKIEFTKLDTKFQEFEKKGLYYPNLYDKEITYQHSYDAFRIFTILRHMYNTPNPKYLTNTVEIFQILDKYYIKDVFKFVENYFKKYLTDVKFSYDIKKDRIYFKISNNNGIMIYNTPFNRLDIYFRRNKVKSLTDQPIQSTANPIKQGPIIGTPPPPAPGTTPPPAIAPARRSSSPATGAPAPARTSSPPGAPAPAPGTGTTPPAIRAPAPGTPPPAPGTPPPAPRAPPPRAPLRAPGKTGGNSK